MTIENGYILLARNLKDDQIMNKPPLYLKVWVWLLLEARFAEFHGLQRGQVYVNMPALAKKMSYNAGYRPIVPTRKEIRQIFDFLRKPNKGPTGGPSITTTKGTHGMVVTICNYDKYQDPNNYEGPTESLTKGHTKTKQGAQYNIRRGKDVEEGKELTTNPKTCLVRLDDSQDNRKLQNAKRILGHWNAKDIIVHRPAYVQKIESPVNAKLTEGHTLEDIEGAIDNYRRILISTDHWFSYNWTLDHFLQRGFEKFRVWKVADANYRTKAIPKGEDEGWSPKEDER